MIDYNAPYIRYAEDVCNGKIIAGDLIIKGCRRFLDDLKREDLEFRPERVERVVEFISILKHFKGGSAGQKFKLENWQLWCVANLVGFYWRGTNTRRFTSAYISIARKNGKTALAGALALYYMIADGEPGAEINLAANTREQAGLCFEFAEKFSRQLDNTNKILRVLRNGIYLDKTASKLLVLSAEAGVQDGKSASAVILDEFHQAKDNKMRDVLRSSQGYRDNPIFIIITTAGFDKDGPCYQLQTAYTEILNGFKKDDSVFIAIYTPNADSDWRDPKTWAMGNPNLGITVKEKYIKDMVESAKNNPQEIVGVLTKNLNIWCDSSEVWIEDQKINQVRKPIDLKQFSGYYCYVGVDLASVSDLTAVCYGFYDDNLKKFYFYIEYYLPEDSLKKGANAELYKEWRRNGWLKCTPGNVTDYSYITKDMLEKQKEFKFTYRTIYFDEWNSVQWATEAVQQGLPITPYSQSIGNFNKPVRALQMLILAGKSIVIDSNPISAFCFRNIKLRSDVNGNVKPDKKDTQNKKIDGVIALIQSLAAAIDDNSGYSNSWVM